ncbi:hypothetical protein BD410DRAFT_814830 [Rickenella mellea]|uniref:RING-type domain-containing protein n=1 Tax=Rickenella mellea TaxID=50990 RepID=A0A4Y7Q6J3_9AGAM|nr:hypothetical protein BD410DRAFT_814830 [Rickenella mellea]
MSDLILGQDSLNTANPANANNNANGNGDKANKDTLFGPSLGVVSSGPDWATVDEKGESVDELTPDIVRAWIAKSKEASEPTTTLQALVNLKRPSIRLSPLAPSDATDSNAALPTVHGLEFEFDCDAPRCRVSMHVVLPSASAATTAVPGDSATAPKPKNETINIFNTTVPGGFGRKLTLGEGAMLDLTRFESIARDSASSSNAPGSSSSPDDEKEKDGQHVTVTSENVTPETTTPMANANSRKRLTFFRRKHDPGNARAAGPALAVVDAEAPAADPTAVPSTASPAAAAAAGNPASAENVTKDKASKKDDEGVRVVIRLTALGSEDSEKERERERNEQVTYLHVVRLGAKSAPAPSSAPSAGADEEGGTTAAAGEGAKDVKEGTAKEETKEEKEKDERPWVVKVVKREAIIGAHTFHLHEIYGLASHASSAPTSLPTSLPPTSSPTDHTYPPTQAQAITPQPDPSTTHPSDLDPTSECLLCLSAPREVVLLPCRHLVACRECAVNMVEFGAGGQVVQREGDAPVPVAGAAPAAAGEGGTAEGGVEGGEGGAGEGSTAQPAAAVAPSVGVLPSQTRRKRKAKGWFCPVCRQPYTSLLRITTAPPPASTTTGANGAAAAAKEKENRDSEESSSHDGAHAADVPATNTNTNTATTTAAPTTDPAQIEEVSANTPGAPPTAAAAVGDTTQPAVNKDKPGFFRHFSRASTKDKSAATAANGNGNGNNGNGNGGATQTAQTEGPPVLTLPPDLERQT